MTDTHLKPCRAAWEQDLAAFRAASKKLDMHDHRTHPDDTNALLDACALAEEKVLGQPAPDVNAVADKLSILWSEDLFSELQEGEQMRQIVGDLRRLARAKT